MATSTTKKLMRPVLPLQTYRFECELIDPILGTVPKDRDVFGQHLQSKIVKGAEDQRKLAARMGLPHAAVMPSGGVSATEENAAEYGRQEAAMIENSEERGWTGFLEDDKGNPCLSSHMILGFLSAVATIFKEPVLKEMGFGHIKQLRNKIKTGVFVNERFLVLPKPPKGADWDGKTGGHPLVIGSERGPICPRSLRASTPMGDRVTVVCSDVVLAGSKFVFTLSTLKGVAPPAKLLWAMFMYGEDGRGLGQWRSSGVFGRFKVTKFVGLNKDGTEYPIMEEEPEEPVEPAPKKKGRPAKSKTNLAEAVVATAKTKPADDDDDDDDDDDE